MRSVLHPDDLDPVLRGLAFAMVARGLDRDGDAGETDPDWRAIILAFDRLAPDEEQERYLGWAVEQLERASA